MHATGRSLYSALGARDSRIINYTRCYRVSRVLRVNHSLVQCEYIHVRGHATDGRGYHPSLVATVAMQYTVTPYVCSMCLFDRLCGFQP